MTARTARTARNCSMCLVLLALLGLLYSTCYYSHEQFTPLTIPLKRTTPRERVMVALDLQQYFFERGPSTKTAERRRSVRPDAVTTSALDCRPRLNPIREQPQGATNDRHA
jgi:hypothetical protein